MENKSSALQTVTRHLVASYREFFDLAAPTAKMHSHQLDLFLDQAMHRQYQVALFFDQDRPLFIGRITRPLGEKRYLVKAYHSNVYRIITEAEVSYIKRFK